MCKTMHTSGRQGDDITKLKLSTLSLYMQWISYSFTYSVHKELYYHCLSVVTGNSLLFGCFFVLFVFVFEAESHIARLALNSTYS